MLKIVKELTDDMIGDLLDLSSGYFEDEFEIDID
jgi:hypothetical protein